MRLLLFISVIFCTTILQCFTSPLLTVSNHDTFTGALNQRNKNSDGGSTREGERNQQQGRDRNGQNGQHGTRERMNLFEETMYEDLFSNLKDMALRKRRDASTAVNNKTTKDRQRVHCANESTTEGNREKRGISGHMPMLDDAMDASKTAAEMASGSMSEAADSVTKMAEMAKNTATEMAETAKDVAMEMGESAATEMAGSSSTVIDAGKGMAEAGKNAAEEMAEGNSRKKRDMPNPISMASDAAKTAGKMATDSFSTAVDAGSKVMNNGKDAAENVAGEFAMKGASMALDVKDKISSMG